MTTSENRVALAAEILNQMGGGRRLEAMIGAGPFIALESGVQFRFKACAKANLCAIILDPSDTYTVKFYKVRGSMVQEVSSESEHYCDTIANHFESFTGLYLHF